MELAEGEALVLGVHALAALLGASVCQESVICFRAERAFFDQQFDHAQVEVLLELEFDEQTPIADEVVQRRVFVDPVDQSLVQRAVDHVFHRLGQVSAERRVVIWVFVEARVRELFEELEQLDGGHQVGADGEQVRGRAAGDHAGALEQRSHERVRAENPVFVVRDHKAELFLEVESEQHERRDGLADGREELDQSVRSP